MNVALFKRQNCIAMILQGLFFIERLSLLCFLFRVSVKRHFSACFNYISNDISAIQMMHVKLTRPLLCACGLAMSHYKNM